MMGRRFGIGMHIDSPGPELIRSGSSPVDRRRPSHAWGLRRIEIELRCRNDLDSIIAPFELGCSAHFIFLSVETGLRRALRVALFSTDDVTVNITTELEPETGVRRHFQFAFCRHWHFFKELE